MEHSPRRTKDVVTLIKNPDQVERRRRQIVDAAVELFIEKGFHKTTTRQIASAAGFSIGSLYEYVKSKEDILYLVCDAIHEEMSQNVTQALHRANEGVKGLAEAIREYFLVCHRMNDHILLIYQETQSLPSQWRKRVLENEVQITGLFVNVLANFQKKHVDKIWITRHAKGEGLNAVFWIWTKAGAFPGLPTFIFVRYNTLKVKQTSAFY